jgi:hypothetical protein
MPRPQPFTPPTARQSPAQATQGTGQGMSGGAIVGIVAIVIGLVIAIACPFIQKSNYEDSIVSSGRGYGISESTSRQLSRSFAEHDRPGEGATVFAVLACLIGIPTIIWLAKRKPSASGNASGTQSGQRPQSNRPIPPANTPLPRQSSPEVDALLRRAFIVLGDADWQKADDLLEQALNREPENAKAYFGKTWVRLQISSEAMLRERLSAQGINLLLEDKDFQKSIHFADNGYRNVLMCYHPELYCLGIYQEATAAMESATTAEQFDFLADKFDSISEYENSFALAVHCRDKAKSLRAHDAERWRESTYQEAVEAMKTAKNALDFELAEYNLANIQGYKDADALAEHCREKIKSIHARDRENELKIRGLPY